jgi:heptosyltransferase-2
MLTSQVSTFRTRVSLSALNLFARVVNRISRRGYSGSQHNEGVARILVLELWNIGDVILAMPFLSQLRHLFPQAEIVLVAKPFAAELLAGTGLVDEFITADLTWTPADGNSLPAKAMSVWRLSRKLSAHKFDLAFSSRLHLREHVLLALSGARRRIGFALVSGDAALTDTVAGDDARHKVEDWLQLLGPFGGASSVEVPKLCIAESERLWASGYVTSRGVQKDHLLVGIHPGASLAEKRWPLERFREVAAAVADQPGVRVLAVADPTGYGSELFAMPGVVGAQVGLRELMALIARCDLLVCNDSGPMHIAGAIGVPTVAMFGSGIDRWFAPLGGGHELLIPDQNEADSQAPATQGGIRVPTGISSSQVIDAVGRAVHRLRSSGTFSRV